MGRVNQFPPIFFFDRFPGLYRGGAAPPNPPFFLFEGVFGLFEGAGVIGAGFTRACISRAVMQVG